MSYLIYKHAFLNGKSYIGVTSSTMEKRFNEHLKNCENGADFAFSRALRKYGKENLVSEVLIENIETKIEAHTIEKYFISFFNTFGSGGYNMNSGGFGGFSHIDNFGDKNPMRKKETAEKMGKILKEKFKTDDNYREMVLKKQRLITEKSRLVTIGKKRPEHSEFLINNSGSYFRAISPEKIEYELRNLSKFIRDFNLSSSMVFKNINLGIIKHTGTFSSEKTKNTVGWQIIREEKN